jgi:hypothetical protein
MIVTTLTAILAYCAIIAVTATAAAQHEDRDGAIHFDQLHRRLNLIEERHDVPYQDKRANPGFPETKYSYLMRSPCRPEKDGYFGATVGAPAIIEYVYEVETSPVAEMERITEFIGEGVMDDVLSAAFPTVCDTTNLGGRRLSLASMRDAGDAKVTGFRFQPEKGDSTSKSTPALHADLSCHAC